MDSRINSAVADLLNAPANTGTASLPPAEKDEAPEAYKFNVAPDQIGLPLEHKDYVKRTCKRCLGRGYQTLLVGDGYREDASGGRVKRVARRLETCDCVHKGYSKTRLAFQKRVDEDVKDIMAGYKGTHAADAEEKVRARATAEALIAFGYADAQTIAAIQRA